MKSVGAGAIFVVLSLYFGESVQECSEESPAQHNGRRPVHHPEKFNDQYVGPAYLGQWPWYGIVYHRKPDRTVKYACGGTLISEKHVITSSICATTENGTLVNGESVLFRIGIHKTNEFNFGYSQYRKVTKIHQPGHADETSPNKIVLLELCAKVKFNKYVQPAYLSHSYFDIAEPLMVGWDLTEGNQHLQNYNASCHSSWNAFNVTIVCDKDRGSIYHASPDFTRLDTPKFVYGIVDCRKQIPCRGYTFFEELIRLKSYVRWIAVTADLNYLQIRKKGQKYDPSRRYPNLLPRRNCGNAYKRIAAYGLQAQLYEYPWMAIIYQKDYNDFLNAKCVGTLISHRYVLTGASELDWHDKMLVRLGEYDTTQTPDCTANDEIDCAPPYKDYDVDYYVIHPDFLYSYSQSIHDIALVRTKKVVLYEDHIQPICLPVTEELQRTQLSEYVFTDWKLHEMTKFDSAILKKKTVSLVNKAECFSEEGIHMDTDVIAVKCTDETDVYLSGAPVGNTVDYNNGARFVQFGIAFVYTFFPDYSSGRPRLSIGEKELSFVYLRNYMDWIVANMHE